MLGQHRSGAAGRHITVEDVEAVLDTGETIEQYPDDIPYPIRLMLGWRGSRPLHVVVAEKENELIVITAYEPDPAQWEDALSGGECSTALQSGMFRSRIPGWRYKRRTS